MDNHILSALVGHAFFVRTLGKLLDLEQIGAELCADARIIRRWHGKALMHAAVPDDPVII